MHIDIRHARRAHRARIGLRAGDDFEILLGGEGDEPNRVPLPDGALSCRSASTTSTGSRASRRLHHRVPRRGRARRPVHRRRPRRRARRGGDPPDRSLTYWNQYMLDARDEQTDNEFGGGYDVKRGLERGQVRVLLLRPRARRGARRRVRHPAEPLLELPPLHPRVVGGARVRDARHQSQPHADPHQRRRPHPGRRRARRPGRAELARHRGPPRGAAHAPVVLADGRSAVAVDPGREAGRRARRRSPTTRPPSIPSNAAPRSRPAATTSPGASVPDRASTARRAPSRGSWHCGAMDQTKAPGPLADITVIELGGIGPLPLLADVVRRPRCPHHPCRPGRTYRRRGSAPTSRSPTGRSR